MKKKSSRTARKLDLLFWFLIWCLPLITFFVVNFRADTKINLEDHLTTNYGYVTLFDETIDTIEEEININFGVLGQYTSYLVTVEIIHLFLDFLLFIPRLAHKWMGAITHNE